MGAINAKEGLELLPVGFAYLGSLVQPQLACPALGYPNSSSPVTKRQAPVSLAIFTSFQSICRFVIIVH